MTECTPNYGIDPIPEGRRTEHELVHNSGESIFLSDHYFGMPKGELSY